MRTLVSELSSAEQDLVLGGTAIDVYGLTITPRTALAGPTAGSA
jgi:hypothetical protein